MTLPYAESYHYKIVLRTRTDMSECPISPANRVFALGFQLGC